MKGKKEIVHTTNHQTLPTYSIRFFLVQHDRGREDIRYLLREEGDLHFDPLKQLTCLHHPAENPIQSVVTMKSNSPKVIYSGFTLTHLITLISIHSP